MNFLFKKKNWTKDETKILALLLEGETDFLEGLRRQLSPPFLLWVERRQSNIKPKTHSIHTSEYVIDVVFDGKLQEKFSLGNEIIFNISDLTIEEANLKRELQVIGTVNYGILTNIRFISNEPVKWPKYIKLKDWSFWLEGKPTKKRVSFEELDIISRKIQISELKDSWVKTLFVKSDKEDIPIGLWLPATDVAISDLELEYGIKLPTDYKEFLSITNGATISGVKLFGCADVYPLEMDNSYSNHLMVILTTTIGDSIALDLSQMKKTSSICPIIFFDHENDKFVTLAESFQEWLTKTVDEAIKN